MAVKNRLQEVKDCFAHAQSRQSCISSFFSWVNPAGFGNVSFFSCGLSNGMTQIINLTKFHIILHLHKQTHGQKRKIRPEISQFIGHQCTVIRLFEDAHFLGLIFETIKEI